MQTDNDKISLLIIAPKPPPVGGIGRWTLLLESWLRKRNDVVFKIVDISPRWRAIDDKGYLKRIIGGVMQGIKDLLIAFRAMLMDRPKVMHLVSCSGLSVMRDVVFIILAKIMRVKTVYHLRFGRLPDIVGKASLEWWFLSFNMWLSSFIIVLDRASFSALSGRLPKGKCVMIPNAIDLQSLDCRQISEKIYENIKKQYRNGECQLLLYLGWIVTTKGLNELFEAWRILSPKGWVLVVAGPGDNKKYVQYLRDIVGNQASVQFLGELPIEETWDYMKQADAFVLPSHTEGFPNVILEAMAASRAIVTTSVGAIPEMLDSDDVNPCGIVVPPKNINALKEAIGQVIGDDDLRFELGRRARRKVEKDYDVSTIFEKYVDIWKLC